MLQTETIVSTSSRPTTGLVVLAAFIGGTSGLCLLIAGLVLITGLSKMDPVMSTSTRLILALLAGFFVLITIAAFNLVRLQQWARHLSIGLGYFVGFWGTLLPITGALPSKKATTAADIVLMVICTYFAALGWASALYLLNREIASRFGVTVEGRPRPLCAWTVGWILLSSLLMIPANWKDSALSIWFGAVFVGSPSKVIELVLGAATIMLVVGLFLGRTWAYRSTVALYLFYTADSLIDLTPIARNHYQTMMLQYKPDHADPRRHLSWLVVSLIVFELTPLFILLLGRKSYTAWCEHRRTSHGLSLT